MPTYVVLLGPPAAAGHAWDGLHGRHCRLCTGKLSERSRPDESGLAAQLAIPAVSAMTSSIPDFLLGVLAQTLSIYLLVLLVRVLLSWFPNLDWSNPVLSGVSAITDPYLNAFRGLIPPIGGLDLSALLAFLALQLLQSLIEGARMSLL